MEISKEELVACIEKARRKLEGSIEDGEEYCYVYEKSVELDRRSRFTLPWDTDKDLNRSLTTLERGISTKAVWMSFFF